MESLKYPLTANIGHLPLRKKQNKYCLNSSSLMQIIFLSTLLRMSIIKRETLTGWAYPISGWKLIMKRHLLLLTLLALQTAYAEDSTVQATGSDSSKQAAGADSSKQVVGKDSSKQPRESLFDKHPECMNRGTDTATGNCIVYDKGSPHHLHPPPPALPAPVSSVHQP